MSPNIAKAEAVVKRAVAEVLKHEKVLEQLRDPLHGVLEAAAGQLAKLDRLPELSAEQHLAVENQRRTIRKLESDLAGAEAALEAARTASHEAVLELAQARSDEVSGRFNRHAAEFVTRCQEVEQELQGGLAVLESLKHASAVAKEDVAAAAQACGKRPAVDGRMGAGNAAADAFRRDSELDGVLKRIAKGIERWPSYERALAGERAA